MNSIASTIEEMSSAINEVAGSAQDHPVFPSQRQSDQRRGVLPAVPAVGSTVDPEPAVAVEELSGLVRTLVDTPVSQALEPPEQSGFVHGASGGQGIGRRADTHLVAAELPLEVVGLNRDRDGEQARSERMVPNGHTEIGRQQNDVG